MGANTKQLRNRIKSVTSTLHLTKAMGLVASSKVRRATIAMNKGKEYKSTLCKAIELLTSSPECAKSKYMKKRDTGRIKLIVIAGDRGLAGGYNANIFRLVREYPNAQIIPIGKRACDKYGGKLLYAENFTTAQALEIAKECCSAFAGEEYDALGIVGTKYVSMMTQEPFVEWVLPLEKNSAAKSSSVLFEPDELTILESVIPEYVAGVLASIVRESFASEVAARRCAMDSAGKNAQEMIDDLSIAYNRARQGAITQEITEIVAGSGQ